MRPSGTAAQDRRLRKVTDCVIETRNACKRYGKLRALDQVSIRVRRGEIYGLIGDNGAGKTTLLKALVGHIWCDEGTVHLLGSQSAHELNAARRQVGAMIERVGCFPSLTVEKNIEYCRMLKGIPDKRKVGEILELVGLSDKAKAKCKSLSMGMQQRLGLAIALIGEPQILILDEPINGLDPSGIHEMRELLRSLNTQKNITILLSSHILSELQQTATTFGFLAKGKLVEEIGIRELTEKCADYLEVALSDVAAFAAILDKERPQTRYIVTPDNKIRLYDAAPAYEFSKLAAEHGILVSELEHHACSLEDYYMNLKEGHHA